MLHDLTARRVDLLCGGGHGAVLLQCGHGETGEDTHGRCWFGCVVFMAYLALR